MITLLNKMRNQCKAKTIKNKRCKGKKQQNGGNFCYMHIPKKTTLQISISSDAEENENNEENIVISIEEKKNGEEISREEEEKHNETDDLEDDSVQLDQIKEKETETKNDVEDIAKENKNDEEKDRVENESVKLEEKETENIVHFWKNQSYSYIDIVVDNKCDALIVKDNIIRQCKNAKKKTQRFCFQHFCAKKPIVETIHLLSSLGKNGLTKKEIDTTVYLCESSPINK
jgi:hypothetical protein